MKKNKIVDVAMRWLFTVCGFLSIIFVIVITAFLVSSGVPAIGEIGIREFLFGTTWASTAKNSEYGILPFILSSVYGTFGAILIGVPFGVLCAVFLAKSSSRKASSVFSSVIELMSGIPSVVLFRADHLKKTGAKVKFISAEPLLESISEINLNGIDWLIVGGESGAKSRPIKEEWVIELKKLAEENKIPFFFKQWGGKSKKKNGSELQGKQYKEYPNIKL